MSSRRERLARAGALAGGAALAISRALTYSLPGRDPAEPVVWATWDGSAVPLFSAGWAIAAILCVGGLIAQLWTPAKARHAIHVTAVTAVAAMCGGWAVVWAAVWLLFDQGGTAGLTAATWAGIAALLLGALGADASHHREER